MIKFFLGMMSLCLAAATAASLEELSSFSELANDLIKQDTQYFTEKLTETTDLPKEFNDFTTILPESPRISDLHSCSYPGTCRSLIDAKNCQRCQFGFVKDPKDDTKCKYANQDKNAFLLTTSLHNIRLISLDGKNTTPMMQYDELSYSSGIDYNFQTNTIFWFCRRNRTLYTAPLLNYVDSEKQSIMHDTESEIRGTAVDWIYNHIYWVDIGKTDLVVSNFNGSIKKVLFSDGFVWPTSIVVDPLSGWMYWDDSGADHIERAGLDGSRREVILSTGISEPQGLALDLVENRLYWSQGSSFSSIWSSNVDGLDRQLIFKSADELKLSSFHFRRIAVFNEHIYLMDWVHNTFYKVNKCNGKDLELARIFEYDLWDFKMYDSSMQPEAENLCSEQIDQCSHFCFPAPSSSKNSVSVSTTTCACPDGMYLAVDKRNCVSELTTLMPV